VIDRREFLKIAGSTGLGFAAIDMALDELAADTIASPDAPTQAGSAKNTILTNASLIDGVQPEPQLRATVVVKDGRIARVGLTPPTRTERHETQVIDLGGAWLLPGLFDVHSHLSSPLQALPGETAIDLYLRMGKEAMDAFAAGITSVRVVGAPDYSDVAWRNAFSRGLFLGPRLVVAGPGLSSTAGHGRYKTSADGPAALRKLVRQRIQGDVDLIKVYISGGVFGAHQETPNQTQFLPDEIEAIFQTAHQRGYKVAVHAGNPEAVKQAVRAGAHTIEHGYVLDEEAIHLMVKQQVILVPTLMITFVTDEAAESPYEKEYVKRWPLPLALRQRANEQRPAHVQSFRAALQAGVPIASGSDQNPLVQAAFLEIETLVRCGMAPMQAIMAATRVAAQAAAIDKELGTVEPGKIADLLVVNANPLDSIHHLRHTVMVIKEGRLAVDKR
jgi:imidazolonepropionase-like amidohydrolase